MTPLMLATLLACPPTIDPGPAIIETSKAPVRVVEMPDDSVPNVYLQAIVRAGSALDPLGSEGIAHLTAQSMLDGGAGTRDGQALLSDLYPTGNSIELVADREWVSFRLTCHKDQAPLCVELFTDVLTDPKFSPADVERVRDDALYTVTEAVLSDEEALGMEVFDNLLFEAHPYGHPVQGRSGVLPLLDDSDALTFHARHYVRANTIAGIAGNYDDALLRDFHTRLEAMPGSPPAELVLQAPLPVEGRSLLAVDTGTPVTGFHLGHPIDVTRSHPDWVALHLGLVAFGQHRQSHGRLFRTLRTARGLNYGDYSYVEPFVQRGWTSLAEQGVTRQQPYFYMWLRPTGSENGAFTLKLAIDELETLVESGLTAQEFDDVKRALTLGTPLTARDPGRRLSYQLEADASGTPNQQGDLLASLEALTLEQVNTALKTHLRPDDLKIVAVSGEAEALVKQLTGTDPTPITYADVEPDEAQSKRDAEIAEKVLDIAADNATTVAAEGIFR